MRWMIWPRQYGKTTKIQEWWMEDPANRVIVTGNEELARIRRRDLLADFTSRLGGEYFSREFDKLLKKRVISYRSYQGMRGVFGPNDQIALDDLDYILSSIFGNVVLAAGVGELIEPDPVHAAKVAAFHQTMFDKYGVDDH